MRSVNCLVTGIAVLVLGLGESARAQTPQQLAACNNSAAPEAQIAGCTALIKSGKYSGRNLAIVFNNRCNAHNRKGAYDLAINDCNQALKLDPNYVIAYSNRCIIYYNKNDYDRAIAAKPSSATPAHAKAYSTRANAYSDKGDHDRAIRDYGEALRINPNDPLTLNNRCDEFALLGQFRAARLDCDKSLKIRLNHANTLRHRGLALLALGSFTAPWPTTPTCCTKIRKMPRRSMDGVPHGDSAGGNQDVASAKAINPNVEKEFWRYGSQAPKPGEFN